MSDKPASDDLTKTGGPKSIITSDLDDPKASRSAESPAHAGIQIIGYRIIREIDTGGQGSVYEAIQESTTQKVAIKIRRKRSRPSVAATKLFEREIRLVANLRHPNIVTVFDSGETEDARRYFVMEYIRGRSFTKHVSESRLAQREMLGLFALVCEAVHYANDKGIVHRDLKPANILIDDQGVPKVLDFGLAKHVAVEPDSLEPKPGFFVGTIRYASPEQLSGQGEDVDRRSDVYSLGVILFELLTGRSPYPSADQVADMLKHMQESPPASPSVFKVSKSDPTHELRSGKTGGGIAVDDDLEWIVLKALAKQRSQRYKYVSDLADDVRAYLRGEPLPSRIDIIYVLRIRFRKVVRRHRVAAIVLVAVLSTVLSYFFAVPLSTSTHSRFEHMMAKYVWSPVPGPAFDAVRVIALTDNSYVESLAASAGLRGVSTQEGKERSLRLLHGALMEKLAVSQCEVVATSITFSDNSEYDDVLLEGARALRDSGIGVVVALWDWMTDAKGRPGISDSIEPVVDWGCTVARVDYGLTTVLLVAKRGSDPPAASLALASFAAFGQSDMDVDYDLNTVSECVDYDYYSFDSSLPHSWNRRPGSTNRIWLTATCKGDRSCMFKGFYGKGIDEESTVGFYYVYVPPNDVLENSTIDYRDVFVADQDQLREWFAGKVVIIADTRTPGSRHQLHDGRIVGSCYIHAAAIDALINGISVRLPRATGRIVIPLVAALIGSFIAAVLRGRPRLRWSIIGGAVVMTILWSCASYRYAQYLVNPIIPIFALLVSFFLFRVLARTSLRHF